ncbi:MAG: hypothetical protein JO264_11840 [Acidisphaera sp.]|nr:hypothetical protein [Acidisphaera sp.]
MRRIALLGMALLLPGCGFDTFVGDTHTFLVNPNRPIGDSENMRRVRAQAVDEEPLKPEPGNVWPGPAAPEPTLADLEQQGNQGTSPTLPNGPTMSVVPPQEQMPRLPTRRGSSTPPPETQPGLTAPPPAGVAPRPATPAAPAPGSRTYLTPHGPMLGTPSGGIDTLTAPNGTSGGIAVPNGNGTTTIIAPDGSITTVPTPR